MGEEGEDNDNDGDHVSSVLVGKFQILLRDNFSRGLHDSKDSAGGAELKSSLLQVSQAEVLFEAINEELEFCCL